MQLACMIFSCCHSFADDDGNVTVGFNETRITVSEGDQFVEVCVVVLDGRVTEPLTVTISTVDGSATGMVALTKGVDYSRY